MAVLAGNATSAVRTSPVASITSVVLLVLNNARKGLSIQNTGTGILYVSFGAPGSTTDYSFQLASGSYYESNVDFTGPVNGVWASTGGNALITEFS